MTHTARSFLGSGFVVVARDDGAIFLGYLHTHTAHIQNDEEDGSAVVVWWCRCVDDVDAPRRVCVMCSDGDELTGSKECVIPGK